MLSPIYATQFRKDFKLCQKRGHKIQKLTAVMLMLENETALPLTNKEHQLQGDYKGFLECHIEPDWLLIYKIDKEAEGLYFARTGTHSDLF
ncbi:MAG: type II toxin-antitoxin system YafQ family toxin [Desulfosporosinus sp.]